MIVSMPSANFISYIVAWTILGISSSVELNNGQIFLTFKK